MKFDLSQAAGPVRFIGSSLVIASLLFVGGISTGLIGNTDAQAYQTALSVAKKKPSCAKKTCSKIASCSEAYYQLNTCGNKSLDRDRDGIPCETICK